MEIILSVLFLLGIWAYFKVQDGRAANYCNTHHVDWGKANIDRSMNGLSQSQVNQNIINGKYDIPASNSNNNETWEEFKRRHPHGSWN